MAGIRPPDSINERTIQHFCFCVPHCRSPTREEKFIFPLSGLNFSKCVRYCFAVLYYARRPRLRRRVCWYGTDPHMSSFDCEKKEMKLRVNYSIRPAFSRFSFQSRCRTATAAAVRKMMCFIRWVVYSSRLVAANKCAIPTDNI